MSVPRQPLDRYTYRSNPAVDTYTLSVTCNFQYQGLNMKLCTNNVINIVSFVDHNIMYNLDCLSINTHGIASFLAGRNPE